MKSLFTMLASLLLSLMPYFTMSGPEVNTPSQPAVAGAVYASATKSVGVPIIGNRDYMSVVYENMYNNCCSRLLFYYERYQRELDGTND